MSAMSELDIDRQEWERFCAGTMTDEPEFDLCPHCEGEGHINNYRCLSCDGEGVVYAE